MQVRWCAESLAAATLLTASSDVRAKNHAENLSRGGLACSLLISPSPSPSCSFFFSLDRINPQTMSRSLTSISPFLSSYQLSVSRGCVIFRKWSEGCCADKTTLNQYAVFPAILSDLHRMLLRFLHWFFLNRVSSLVLLGIC